MVVGVASFMMKEYNAGVSKNCYFGGFLYHVDSQQILLQQNSSDPELKWTLLENFNKKNYPEAILPVYDYVLKGEKHVISYAEVTDLKDFPVIKNLSFKWFTLKEISKLPLSRQTKQDIIIGRRVIDSQMRKMMGELTRE